MTQLTKPAAVLALILLSLGLFAPRTGKAQERQHQPDAAWARLSVTAQPESGLGFGFGGAVRVGSWIAGGHGRMHSPAGTRGGDGSGMVQVGRQLFGTRRVLVWPSVGAGVKGTRSDAWFATEAVLNMDVFLRPGSRRGGPVFGLGAGVRNRTPVLEWHVGWGQ